MQINQLKLCFQKKKKKKTSIRNFTGNMDHINKKVKKQGYTCRNSSGQVFQSVAVAELGIKSPLEYLQV